MSTKRTKRNRSSATVTLRLPEMARKIQLPDGARWIILESGMLGVQYSLHLNDETAGLLRQTCEETGETPEAVYERLVASRLKERILREAQGADVPQDTASRGNETCLGLSNPLFASEDLQALRPWLEVSGRVDERFQGEILEAARFTGLSVGEMIRRGLGAVLDEIKRSRELFFRPASPASPSPALQASSPA